MAAAESRVSAIRGDGMRSELVWLRESLRQSYGASGRLSLICPFAGAALTCSNRSNEIAQLIKSDNPVVKLILSSVRLHSQHFMDSGLYVGQLISNLILRGLDLPHPQYKVAIVTSHVMSLVCDWFKSVECPARKPLSLSSTGELMTLLKSFLSSKLTVYGVSNLHLEHLSSLLLQGFLRVSPNSPRESFSFAERVHVTSSIGQPVHQSRLLGGVVIPVSRDVANVSLMRRCEDGTILVALFNGSLAGDSDDCLVGVSLEAESETDILLEDVVVSRLMRLAASLVGKGVGLVGCQKCIHPQVSDYLRENCVCVLDRLSLIHFGPVKSVSGAELDSHSFDESAVFPYHLGRLKTVKLVNICGRSFLQLEGNGDDHASLIITARLSRVAEVATALCKDAVCLLQHSLVSPAIFTGGGCMETITANFIQEKINGLATDECLSELQCNRQTFTAVANSVADSFVAMATSLEHDRGTIVSDSVFHHCWLLPPLAQTTPTLRPAQVCGCGLIASSVLPEGCRLTTLTRENVFTAQEITQSDNSINFPSVCDFYFPKLRATELAGDVASSVLHTGWIASPVPRPSNTTT